MSTMDDSNESSHQAAERLTHHLDDVLRLYTEQFVSLQKVVSNAQSENKADMAKLQEGFVQLKMEMKDQSSSMENIKTSVVQSHEREVNRFASLLETAMQVQLRQNQQQQQHVLQSNPLLQLFGNPVLQQQFAGLSLSGQLPFFPQEGSQSNVTQQPPITHDGQITQTLPTQVKNEVPAASATQQTIKSCKQVAPVTVVVQQQEPNDFGDKFKKKEGEWDCKACYTRNGPTQNQCMCCETAKGSEAVPTTQSFKPSTCTAPTNTSGFKFGLGVPANKFPAVPSPLLNQALEAKTPVPAKCDPVPVQKALFGGSGVSFASLAAQKSSDDKTLFGIKDNSSIFKVEPKAFPVFGQNSALLPTADQYHPDEGDAPEEFKPDDSQFKRPDIALPDLVQVKTGEEEEEPIFISRAKLYRFFATSKEVKERGAGEIKLLRHKGTGKVRCVMRRDQVFKLCANFAIVGVKPSFKKDKLTTLIWTCVDFSDREDHPSGEACTLLGRFRSEEDAKQFKQIIEREGKDSAGFEPDEGKPVKIVLGSPENEMLSTTPTSVPERAGDQLKMSGSVFGGATIPSQPTSATATPNTTFSFKGFCSPAHNGVISPTVEAQATVGAPLSFTFNPNKMSSTNNSSKSLNFTETKHMQSTDPMYAQTSMFGGGIGSASSAAAEVSTFTFKGFGAALTPACSESKPSFFGSTASSDAKSSDADTFPAVFGKSKGGLTFSALSQSGNASFLSGKDDRATFSIDQKKHSFLSTPLETQEGEEPEEFKPDDSQFKRPDIALPDLVQVKTGEEDENVLFSARAKLYRFFPETKDVKERGSGGIKVLKHPANGKVRVVMRRDQVLKLCANFVVKNVKPSFKKDKDNTLVWNCCDYSERDEHPDGEHITLICRFKDSADANRFKKLIDGNQD